jgi:superfamily II DNA or RNA helicase
VEVIEESPEPPPAPHFIQQEALAALKATREAGNEAGLVVLATGLGKTWLAAFDSASEDFRQVLFVAHREEILTQAMQTFRRIRPRARLGLYTGKEKSPDANVLFASIQTLGRTHHLGQFAREQFDYIVVDEFHHAAARTYRRLIEYFTPRFLLGLTATPERMDGGDLLALCQENLVYRRDLVAGIEAGLLCPFRYFGVPDDVDYSNIPWRSNRFDEEELTKAVATTRRAQNALEQFRQRAGSRTLGFCCSQRHADFMADYFSENGVRAVAVHSGQRSAPRASALEALANGRLDILFAVDMFNEGLDIPSVDTVLMLRPTESNVIWLQQFGRGLRQSQGKSELKVIDYIGNHKVFLVKVRSLLQPLLGCGESRADLAAAMRLVEQGRAELPEGCHVTYDLEAIDIIRSLLPPGPGPPSWPSTTTSASDMARVQRPLSCTTPATTLARAQNPRLVDEVSEDDGRSQSPGERKAVESAGDFFDVLETTPMTKSFKMLTLAAMLNQDALPGRIGIGDLTTEFRRIARRSSTLRDDVGEDLEDDTKLRSLIENNPIAAWCGGKGTGGRAYFEYNDTELSTDIPVPTVAREELQNLVRELVEWRLAEYLDRGDSAAESGRFVCRVLHASGRPILKLPDRKNNPGIPFGWVDVLANDQPHVANFAKEFVNVVRTDRESETNVLADIIRGWFGPDAGRPGTRYEVAFEPAGDALQMLPVVIHQAN